MARTFIYKKKFYSVSDRNDLGEFVVVQFNYDKKEVLGAKVIPARTEYEVEKYVRLFPFQVFRNLPQDPMNPSSLNSIH
jgi:hypothetical protein